MVKFWRTAAVAAVVLALSTIASPANANTTEGYVAGAGSVSDDFNDEGVVDYNSHATSWAAGMWQAILYADGAIETDGTTFDAADIDCDFGPNTTQATKSWQSARGLGADGSAGSQTWTKAGQKLVLGSVYGDDEYYVYYQGSKHTVTFLRQGIIGTTRPHAYMNAGSSGFGMYAMLYSGSGGIGCASSDFF